MFHCFMLHSTSGTSHYFHCSNIVTCANIHCTSVAHSEFGFARVSCYERHLILTHCKGIVEGGKEGAPLDVGATKYSANVTSMGSNHPILMVGDPGRVHTLNAMVGAEWRGWDLCSHRPASRAACCTGLCCAANPGPYIIM